MVEPIGRRTERDLLHAALGAAEAGRRTVVHVRAAAGMGKSTLLDDTVTAALQRGHAVVSGGLSAAETGLSWAGLVTLLRRVPADVLAALPEAPRDAIAAATGAGAGDADPMSVAAGLSGVLRALAAERPVTVVVDDVHWLDQASAAALAFAVRATEGIGCGFVLAGRPVDLPLDPERLVAPSECVVVDLEGLSLAGTRLLLDAHFAVQLGRVDLIRLHETTGGNPLHVIEAGRLLAAGQPIDAALLPPSVQAVVEASLVGVDAAALPVLRIAALAAAPTVGLLARVFPRDQVDAALAAGEASSLLRVRSDAVVFRHPTLVTGLVEGAGSYERRRLEALLADAVEDDEQRALHLAAAAAAPDTATADAMDAAAAAALRRGAVHLAAERYLRAWELTPDDQSRLRMMRRVLAADAFDMAGDAARALPMHREVVDAAEDDDMRWEATLGLVVSTAHAVGEVAAAELIEALKAAAGDRPDRVVRAHEIAVRLRLFNGTALAHEEAMELLRHARAGDDLGVVLRAEAMLGLTSLLSGEPYDVAALHDRAVAHYGPDSPLPGVLLGEHLVWTEHPAVADQLERSVAEARRLGTLVHVGNALDQLSDCRLRRGEWDDAQRHLETYCDMAVAAGEMVSVAPRLADLAYLDALRGRFESADQHLAAIAGHRQSFLETVQADVRRGQVLWIRGDAQRAVEVLEPAVAALDACGVVDAAVTPCRGDLVDALLAVGRVDDAAALAALLRTRADHTGRARALAESHRAEAAVLAAQGDLAGAERAAQTALDAALRLAAPFEHARCTMLCGTVARRTGRRSAARGLLNDARAVLVGLGALPFVARVDAELERCGEDRSTGGLTPTERRIAALVHEGRTNAEIASEMFISVRTVESNLTKLYRKLSVRSRTELARRIGDGVVD